MQPQPILGYKYKLRLPDPLRPRLHPCMFPDLCAMRLHHADVCCLPLNKAVRSACPCMAPQVSTAPGAWFISSTLLMGGYLKLRPLLKYASSAQRALE